MKLGTKQKQQQLYLVRIGIAVVLLLCVLVAISVVKRYQIAQEMEARREGLTEEKAELEARKATLQERVEYLQDERSVEAEIRRNFDVAKEGEQVVIILDEPTAAAPLPTTTVPEAEPWYVFWR